MGHKANNCPVRREEYKRKHKRQHAHIAEYEEPPMKMIKDHVLISALSGSVSPGEDTWLIDNGASKHMKGLPELKVDQTGICNGCAQGKNIKNPFPKRDNKA
jgi:hypothetical protein